MLNEVRNWLRFLGETVNLVAPIGGTTETGVADVVRLDNNALNVVHGYYTGGTSKKIELSDADQNVTLSGNVFRLVSTQPCFVRIDLGSGAAAQQDLSDNITIWLPAFHVEYFRAGTPSGTYYVSAKQDSSLAGTLYASVIS